MIDRVALLRGINVGGHRVKMAELRALFAAMGFADVETFIASGNVLFRTADHDDDAVAARIERDLEEALGYGVPTFLRTRDALSAVVDAEPRIDFGDDVADDARSTYVVFLDAATDTDMRGRFDEISSAYDRFTFREREIYWSMPGKLSASPLFQRGLDRALGDVRSTTRNMTTVRRLLETLSGRAAP
jgi:uncharacterized protein (DUF1697 family)